MPNRLGGKTTTERGLGHDYRKLADPMRRAAVGTPCPRCGVTMTKQVGRKPRPTDATVDHVTPRALGGGNVAGNLAVCCRRCNVTPGARLGGLTRAARRRPRVPGGVFGPLSS